MLELRPRLRRRQGQDARLAFVRLGGKVVIPQPGVGVLVLTGALAAESESAVNAYYNEIDPKSAAWLRELIKQGHIAKGEVDERSIVDIRPDDLSGFTQYHFFAGIGVWSHALRRAGWADDRPVWTGSCPCQPFSAAGKGEEFGDERHLWPAWFRLIRECRPVAVFGEQVASKDALSWLDHVSTDLEAEGYAVGAVSAVACGFGAPHIRQRLYFVADSQRAERRANGQRRDASSGREQAAAEPGGNSTTGCMADTQIKQRWGFGRDGKDDGGGDEMPPGRTGDAHPAATNGFWSDAEWIPCRDGKARPTKPGTFPLVAGIAKGMVRSGDNSAPIDADNSPEARVMRLRGYGNSINAEQARNFIEAYQDVRAA